MTAAWLGVAGFVAASRRTASRIASGTRTFRATVGAPRRARGAYPPAGSEVVAGSAGITAPGLGFGVPGWACGAVLAG